MNGRPQVLDVSRLPAVAFMHRSPVFWGAMGIVIIEGTMFVLLIASYFYARSMLDVWPPPGVRLPGLFLPTLELLVLLASVPPAYWATEASKHNDRPRLKFHLFVNGALAAVARVIRFFAWSDFNFTWKSDIHGSIVWMILVMHSTEVLAAVVFTFWLFGLAFTSLFGIAHRKAVDFDSVTWYFLVAIWVPLYATIYIAPYLVRGS